MKSYREKVKNLEKKVPGTEKRWGILLFRNGVLTVNYCVGGEIKRKILNDEEAYEVFTEKNWEKPFIISFENGDGQDKYSTLDEYKEKVIKQYSSNV